MFINSENFINFKLFLMKDIKSLMYNGIKSLVEIFRNNADVFESIRKCLNMETK